jgi:hypothetical protein
LRYTTLPHKTTDEDDTVKLTQQNPRVAQAAYAADIPGIHPSATDHNLRQASAVPAFTDVSSLWAIAASFGLRKVLHFGRSTPQASTLFATKSADS